MCAFILRMVSFDQGKIFELSFCGGLAPEGGGKAAITTGDLVGQGVDVRWGERREAAAAADMFWSCCSPCGNSAWVTHIGRGKESDVFPALDRTGSGRCWGL